MPNVVTHRYDPVQGAALNLCDFPDFEASRVLDRLRRESRPTLKPNYLARRRATEEWLAEAANKMLRRIPERRPWYFFLGDFSYYGDPSRPAALVIPLASLPAEAITFTLGDSMTVVEESSRRVYNFGEMVDLFRNDALARFSLSNRCGFETHFIEAQLWDRSSLQVP